MFSLPIFLTPFVEKDLLKGVEAYVFARHNTLRGYVGKAMETGLKAIYGFGEKAARCLVGLLSVWPYSSATEIV